MCVDVGVDDDDDGCDDVVAGPRPRHRGAAAAGTHASAVGVMVCAPSPRHAQSITCAIGCAGGTPVVYI